MSANLPLQTLTIKNWLDKACLKLQETGIKSARLDAELVLANTINESRTYLHAHSDKNLNKTHAIKADSQLERRIQHEPIAYIVGYKEFYGRKFIVTSDTLIPRPESEDFIEILKQILTPTTYHSPYGDPPTKLIDVGTGCGCLGLTAKLEFPDLEVTLTDISDKALQVAKQNAEEFNIYINYLQSDLLKKYKEKPNIIIANLPYVDDLWQRSPETDYEPDTALFADNHGLSIIKQLIAQASLLLATSGYLIIEADPDQHSHLKRHANEHDFSIEQILNYIITFKKL